MTQDGVSPAQGHESIATPSVITAPVHSGHRSIITSLYRGPTILNMAETEEEKKVREETERKAQEDQDKKDNFKKVQEAREKAEAERDQLLKEKAEREAADKKAADEKLAEEGRLQELADSKQKEADEKTAEAAREKVRADELAAKVKGFEDAQEAELAELLKEIPEEKRPPLDAADSVSKRLTQVKHVASLLSKGPKPPVGGGAKHDPNVPAPTKKDLLAKPPGNADDAFALMETGGQ